MGLSVGISKSHGGVLGGGLLFAFDLAAGEGSTLGLAGAAFDVTPAGALFMGGAVLPAPDDLLLGLPRTLCFGRTIEQTAYEHGDCQPLDSLHRNTSGSPMQMTMRQQRR